MTPRLTPPGATKLVSTCSPCRRSLWPLLKPYCHGYSSEMPKSSLRRVPTDARWTTGLADLAETDSSLAASGCAWVSIGCCAAAGADLLCSDAARPDDEQARRTSRLDAATTVIARLMLLTR